MMTRISYNHVAPEKAKIPVNATRIDIPTRLRSNKAEEQQG